MRPLIALLALVAALALGAPAAYATDATGSGDGLTVTVSLSDTATAGQPFTVAESITNTTARGKLVRVTQTLAGPSGNPVLVLVPVLRSCGEDVGVQPHVHVPRGTAGDVFADAESRYSERDGDYGRQLKR